VAVEAHRNMERRDSHIFETIRSQMAVGLSALRPDLPLLPGRFLALISFKVIQKRGTQHVIASAGHA
jgi:hypothetical protein